MRKLPPPTALRRARRCPRTGTRRPSPGCASSACRRAASRSASRRRNSAAPPPSLIALRRRPCPRSRPCRGGQHALADAVLQLLLQLVRRHGEHAARAMPGRPSGVSSGDSARSMPASQPQAITEVAKPVMRLRRDARPALARRGDQQPRRAHAEGFRKGVVDRTPLTVTPPDLSGTRARRSRPPAPSISSSRDA